MTPRSASGVPLTLAGYLPLCEVCDHTLTPADLDDDVTLPSECCEQCGMCATCRLRGNHDCPAPKG